LNFARLFYDVGGGGQLNDGSLIDFFDHLGKYTPWQGSKSLLSKIFAD